MNAPSVSIGEVAVVNPRFEKADRPAPRDPVSFVPMAAVSEQTVSIVEANDRPYEEVAKGYTAFKRGDVLIAKITPCFENGKMALADNLPRDLGFGSTEFHVIRASEKVDTRYLFNLLRNPYVRRAGEMKMKGAAGQRRVPAEFFSGLKIPLPPLKEQKRIAKILDAADALRAKRRESLAQLNALLQSVFLDLFGDPSCNPHSWKICKMGEVCKKITDGTHHSPPIVEQGVPYVTAKHIKFDGVKFFENPWYVSPEEHAKIYSRCDPLQGDVLYIKDGATTGVAAINHFNFEFSMLSSVALIRPNKDFVLPEYICAYLNNEKSKRRFLGDMGGAAIKRLTLAKIKRFDIPVPDMETQKKFSRVVCRIQEQSQKLRDQLDCMDQLFTSLQQRAFSGEL